MARDACVGQTAMRHLRRGRKSCPYHLHPGDVCEQDKESSCRFLTTTLLSLRGQRIARPGQGRSAEHAGGETGIRPQASTLANRIEAAHKLQPLPTCGPALPDHQLVHEGHLPGLQSLRHLHEWGAVRQLQRETAVFVGVVEGGQCGLKQC